MGGLVDESQNKGILVYFPDDVSWWECIYIVTEMDARNRSPLSEEAFPATTVRRLSKAWVNRWLVYVLPLNAEAPITYICRVSDRWTEKSE
jgi:hypothetical protein